jgi:NNP family nitrate/nitrite transporter-like MFS transporter
MPAVFDSLVRRQGLTPHVAWRVAYVVPFVIIVSIALGMLFLCDDTPTGKWADRGQAAVKSYTEEGSETSSSIQSSSPSPLMSNRPSAEFEKKGDVSTRITAIDAEAQRPQRQTEASGDVIVEPTVKESLAVLFSKESLALAGPYAASFGMLPQLTENVEDVLSLTDS